MRVLAVALALSIVPLVAACGEESPGVDQGGGPTLIPPGNNDGTATGTNPGTTPGTNGTNSTPNGTNGTPAGPAQLDEVVYVLIGSFNGGDGGGFCTGTLVAKDRVVTAAHCLESEKFVSWEIVAPLAPGKPRVSASNPKVFGGSFEDVANPDIGTLTLSKEIVLPVYAQLTDVVAQVEAGAKVEATAVVRTDKTPEAPLFTEATMPVSSTVSFGYEHGFGTPYFSKGGDSGAGLFLVENGKLTHKLIGVARQPEPERNVDHFTRIDAAFLAWYQ